MSDDEKAFFRIAAAVSFFLFIWLVADPWKQDEAVMVADAQVQQAVEQQAERQSNTLTVSRATSTIVFVGDAQSEYGRKWLSNEAAQCEAKGWQIKTVDLSGMDDPKFFVYAGGEWKIHNGHLSLQTLTTLLSRTTPPQPRSMQTGLPSVAEGLSK